MIPALWRLLWRATGLRYVWRFLFGSWLVKRIWGDERLKRELERKRSESMGAETRSELLARYRAAPKLLAESVAGSSLAQLDGAPPEPGWTARQNVHHVSDIAVMGALRLRLMLVDIEVEYLADRSSRSCRNGCATTSGRSDRR